MAVTISSPEPSLTITNATNQITFSLGRAGADGQGVVAGGTTGQILAKASGTDYDTEWITAGTGDLLSTNNLSDLANVTTARTNLGLGTAAVTASTDYATSAQGLLAASATQPGDNVSTLTNDAGYLTGITGETLSSLSDVTITTIASGELLKWNGSAWVNNTIAEAGLATSAQGALADSALQSVAAADITDATVDGIALITSADANPFTDADETKLDGIETGATADQTDAEILAAVESESGRDMSADGAKLDGLWGGTNKLDATTAPTANDDASNTSGNGTFSVGSVWIDTTADESYRCADSTATAAVWVNSSLESGDLASVAISGSASDLSTGTLPIARIADGDITEAKLNASTNASLDLADSATQPGDNISTLTNDSGYLTSVGFADADTDLGNALDIFNAIALDSPAVTVTESAGTVYLNLEKGGGGDVRFVFSDGVSTLDCTPTAQVALTAGSDISPTLNYVYIPQSTKTLTASTTGFPSAEHAPIATVLVQSAAHVATDGAYKVHAWTDHSAGSDNQGHLAHLNYWIRYQNATWLDGIAITPTVGAATFDIATTSGTVLQLHDHNFPAFDTSTGSSVFIVNDPTTAYLEAADLTQTYVSQDVNGTALGGASTDFYNLVIWGCASESDGDCKLFCNLPDGAYPNNNANQATLDTESTAIYTIPSEFKGCGFLIARLTVSESAGTYTIEQNEDLRGQFPSTAAGGAGGATSNEFADNVFRIQDEGDVTKEIAFQASGITTGTTRTITMPDSDVNLGTLDNSTDVTIAAGLDYISITGQELTLGSVDLSTDVTGTLPVANGGTGAASLPSPSNYTPGAATVSGHLSGIDTALASAGGGAFSADGDTQITPTTAIVLDQATGNEIGVDISYTVNKATSGNDTGLRVSMTDTASPGTSLLIDGQVGGSTVFSVNELGAMACDTVEITNFVGNPTGCNLDVSSGLITDTLNSSAIDLNSGILYFATTELNGDLQVAASGNISFGAVTVLADSAGTTTLQNIDAIDATTETTLEAAIDSLSNLTVVGTIGTGVWQGTAIGDAYIASAATWNAKQDALTFGIADGNAVDIDAGATIANNDYAKFTTTGLIGQTYAEVKTDLSLNNVENTALSTWAGSSNIATVGTITSGTWNGTAIVDAYIASAATWNAKIANLSEDTTPQLGGSLDVNGNKIVSTTNGDIDIEPNGTGNVLLGNFAFDADQTVGAGQDNYILTYDNATGLISLEAAAAGGGTVDTSGTPVANDFARFTDADTIEGRSYSEVRTDLNVAKGRLGIVIDGAGSAITTGIKADLEVPYDCTINEVRLLADQSGSAVVDIWKDTYANFPPTDADSITASAVPTLSAATKSEDSTLTGWSTSLSASSGDILRFNVDSASTVTRLTVILEVTRA